MGNSPSQGIFVTGTDTDVGKTILSTLLCIKLKAHYWKPIQSGSEPHTDSQFLERFIGAENILPERHLLTQPLSPNHAASLDQKEILLSDFQLPHLERPLIVEGAGGVFVPINDQETNLDLMQKLKLPIVIAARSGLGTLNHTLLTIEALKRRSLSILGVVMIGTPNQRNKESIEHFGDVPVLFELPWQEKITKDWLLEMSYLFPLTTETL